MKTYAHILAVVSLFSAQATLAQSSQLPVEEKETIRRTLEFAGPGTHTLDLDNLSGSIHVTATDAHNLEMAANKTVRAESQDRVRDAQRDVKMEISDKADTIRIYIDGPARCSCSGPPRSARSFFGAHNDPGYRVTIDFDLRVPADTKLRLSTIDGGSIAVENMRGDFDIANVNGSVTMTDIRGSGIAETVNGTVKVSFAENPRDASSFKTTNGVIEAQFQPDLSADLRMKTFNGGLYTDFDVTALPQAAPVVERVNGKFVYRSNGFTGVRVGKGGPEIKFDGFNGDVRILRRTR